MHWRENATLPDRARWLSSTVVGNVLSRWAVDVTIQSSRRSCLVLAPHPDDETLACGATLARKLEAGTEVHVLVMTEGETWPPDRDPQDNAAIRVAELRRATRVLGLSDSAVVHQRFPETQLHTVVEALSDAVADAVRQLGPEEVYTTSVTDPHSDHAALGRATRRALAGASARLLVYPIWQWERPRSWLQTLGDTSRPEAVTTAGYLDRKRSALRQYSSQIVMSDIERRPNTMGPLLLRHFLATREVFFPVRP